MIVSGGEFNAFLCLILLFMINKISFYGEWQIYSVVPETLGLLNSNTIIVSVVVLMDKRLRI